MKKNFTCGPGVQDKRPDSVLDALEEELREGLSEYWEAANLVLDQSRINLFEPGEEYWGLESNLFSALFLYSYMRTGIPRPRRILYVAANQCLRGMVTGCDNILDEEYKQTLATDLPEEAHRFRSVLDIMVSDRVLFALLLQRLQSGDVTLNHVLLAGHTSLRCLTDSGAQEASEEKGSRQDLRPEEVLEQVHRLKTGLLFQAPWALPDLLENGSLRQVGDMKQGLFDIGMGCQILDDMNDLASDLCKNRQNYVLALIRHRSDRKERLRLDEMSSPGLDQQHSGLVFRFPRAGKTAFQRAMHFLNNGCDLLFAPEHQTMKHTARAMILKRIGADRFSPLLEGTTRPGTWPRISAAPGRQVYAV